MHIWLDVHTPYGSTTVQVTNKHYQRAMSAPNGQKNSSRDTICIRVREKLNAAGANIRYLAWNKLTFTSVRKEEVEPQTKPDVTIPEDLFMFVAPDHEGIEGENPCGCVPYQLKR